MTRLYMEAAVGVLLAAILTVMGWHFGSLHWKGQYDELVASQDAASAKSAADAAHRIQDERSAYDSQLKAITDSYHHELSATDSTNDALAQQLRDYSSRLSRCSVPKSAGAAVRADAPRAEPASDSGIAEALGSLVKAAGADAAELTALQSERQSLK